MRPLPSEQPPFLTSGETRQALPFAALVAALASAVRELDDGRIACPVRQVVPLAENGKWLSMSAVASDIAVHKLVSVVPDNPRRGLPTIQGRVTVIDPTTGRATMTLDAATVTGRRTAAMTFLGIAALAPAPPRTLLLIGTGVQASHHVDAIAALHPTTTVFVRARDASSARRFVEGRPDDALRLVALDALADTPAVDVVVTCTSSRVPVYRAPASVDRLVVAVGAYEPDVAEIAADTVRASRVFVDDLSGARHEAGDLIVAGTDPRSIGSLAGALAAAPPRDRPLLLKTVGCAAWDLAAARVARAELG